ncbi:putative quinol monooxygenase [soil metagenome]
MIAAIATLRTKPGTQADFEAAFAALAAKVRSDEPGNKLYTLTRSQAEEGVYKVMEIYADADAVQAHRDSAHFKELGAALGPFMAGRAEVERLDVV